MHGQSIDIFLYCPSIVCTEQIEMATREWGADWVFFRVPIKHKDDQTEGHEIWKVANRWETFHQLLSWFHMHCELSDYKML